MPLDKAHSAYPQHGLLQRGCPDNLKNSLASLCLNLVCFNVVQVPVSGSLSSAEDFCTSYPESPEVRAALGVIPPNKAPRTKGFRFSAITAVSLSSGIQQLGCNKK